MVRTREEEKALVRVADGKSKDPRGGPARPVSPETGDERLQTAFRSDVRIRSARCRRLGLWLAGRPRGVGLRQEEKKIAPSVSEPPVLHVIHPELRKIVRVVGQPSFVQSYERTSIYPKMTAYIEKWNVDIGDKVQKGRRAR